MREVFGDIWEYPADYICITTNGGVRKDGAAVMGRGVALQAKQRFPGIEFILGRSILEYGNIFRMLTVEEKGLFIFPVKYHWRERADLTLIEKSTTDLRRAAELRPGRTFVLPRPGCGNGRLLWEQVKPVLERVGLPDNVHVIDRPRIQELRTEAKFKDAKAISGIFDITGGLDASEYVRRMRDA